MPLLAAARDLETYSEQSFFSRVLDDVRQYSRADRQDPNIDAASQARLSTMDDNFMADGVTPMAPAGGMTVSKHTLTKLDFYLYIIGILVRIQTIVLGYILFGVETENTCVVDYGYY